MLPFRIWISELIKQNVFKPRWLLINLQERRIAQEIASIERDTGFKLRVLAQNYPDTPGTVQCRIQDLVIHLIQNIDWHFHFPAGLAIKDFWNVDDQTIVFVADPTFGKGFICSLLDPLMV